MAFLPPYSLRAAPPLTPRSALWPRKNAAGALFVPPGYGGVSRDIRTCHARRWTLGAARASKEEGRARMAGRGFRVHSSRKRGTRSRLRGKMHVARQKIFRQGGKRGSVEAGIPFGDRHNVGTRLRRGRGSAARAIGRRDFAHEDEGREIRAGESRSRQIRIRRNPSG